MPSSQLSVIGKGVVGLSCAYRLAQAGFTVTLISASEKRSASSVATGVSTVKGERVGRQLLFRLKQEAHKSFSSQLTELAKLDSSLSFAHGISEPFLDSKDYHEITSRVYSGLAQSAFGNECVWESPSFFSSKVRGYHHYPKDVCVDAEQLLFLLEKLCKELGVRFVDSEVIKIDKENSDNLPKYQVHLSSSFIHADDVFLCAGAGSSAILRSSGFSSFDLSEHPAATLDIPLRSNESRGFCHHKDVFVHSAGRLRVGSYELDGFSSSAQAKEPLFVKAATLFELGEASLESSSLNVGVRVRGRKMLPLVGKFTSECGKKQIYLATGMYKSGFQLADFIACNLVIHVRTGQFRDKLINDLGQPIPS